MKLKELSATKIVKMVMGERDGLRGEDELAMVLKKRLTKKERVALNSKAEGCVDLTSVLADLNVDQSRFDEIVANAVKKIKNESLHRELYN